MAQIRNSKNMSYYDISTCVKMTRIKKIPQNLAWGWLSNQKEKNIPQNFAWDWWYFTNFAKIRIAQIKNCRITSIYLEPKGTLLGVGVGYFTKQCLLCYKKLREWEKYFEVKCGFLFCCVLDDLYRQTLEGEWLEEWCLGDLWRIRNISALMMKLWWRIWTIGL